MQKVEDRVIVVGQKDATNKDNEPLLLVAGSLGLGRSLLLGLLDLLLLTGVLLLAASHLVHA
jgi:hypothetical protein